MKCGPTNSKHLNTCSITDPKVNSMLYILLVGGSLYAGFISFKHLAQAILMAAREIGPRRR